MLDGSVKTVMVDDSKTVGELLVTICSRIGKIVGPTCLRIWFSAVLCILIFRILRYGVEIDIFKF